MRPQTTNWFWKLILMVYMALPTPTSPKWSPSLSEGNSWSLAPHLIGIHAPYLPPKHGVVCNTVRAYRRSWRDTEWFLLTQNSESSAACRWDPGSLEISHLNRMSVAWHIPSISLGCLKKLSTHGPKLIVGCQPFWGNDFELCLCPYYMNGWKYRLENGANQ